MSASTVETFLARLYTEAALRERFIANKRGEALGAGLSDDDAEALVAIDVAGLRMAAASYARKREGHRRQRKGLFEWLLRRMRGRGR